MNTANTLRKNLTTCVNNTHARFILSSLLERIDMSEYSCEAQSVVLEVVTDCISSAPISCLLEVFQILLLVNDYHSIPEWLAMAVKTATWRDVWEDRKSVIQLIEIAEEAGIEL
jgi:hypothetical protein